MAESSSLVLERHDDMVSRGARTDGEVAGYGHAARAMRGALEREPVDAHDESYGHALGASDAWEAVRSSHAIAHGRTPVDVDRALDPDLVRAGRALAPRVLSSNSTGFGGIDAALVLRSVEG